MNPLRECLKLRHLFIFFLVVFLLPWNLQASESCELIFFNDSPSNYRILGDLRVNEKKPIVKQCMHSCYFEAAVSVVESGLSRYMGQPVQISRPLLFGQLMIYRLEYLLNEKNFRTSLMKSEDGILDITSLGNTYMMTELLNDYRIPVVPAKTQAEVYLEDQKIERLYREVGSNLHRVLEIGRAESYEVKDQEAANLRTRQILSTRLEALKRGVQTSLDKSTGLHSSSVDLRLGLHIEATKLEFETDHSYQIYFQPQIEKMLIRRLKETGELFLGYYHIRRFVKRQQGRDGFLDLPEAGEYMPKSKLRRLKIGGDHAAAVVDVLLNKQGRITHLVLRDSKGSEGGSDHGYIYVSVDYLDHYGGAIYDWTFFEKRN